MFLRSTLEWSGEGSVLQRAPEEWLTAPEPPEPLEYNFVPEHELILLMR